MIDDPQERHGHARLAHVPARRAAFPLHQKRRDRSGASSSATLDSHEVKPLFKTTSRVLYAEPGYLLFVRENTLVAQKFDAKSLTLDGDAVPIGEGLGVDSVGLASFSVSRNGVLAFRAGDLQGRRLVWLDRTGKEMPAIDEIGDYHDTAISPDGKRLVFDAGTPTSTADIWIRDLARGVTTRFTFDAAAESIRLVARRPPHRLHFAGQGTGGPVRQGRRQGPRTRSPARSARQNNFLSDWSRDGAHILYTVQGDDGWDIWALPMTGATGSRFR